MKASIGLVVGDPRNPDANIQETSDVLAQWFIPGVADALQIVLVAWLFTGSNEVFDKVLTQSIPGVELVLRETDKPLMPHRVDHHGKVIGHDMLVTHSRSASGLIKLDPELGINLIIVMVKLFKLKTSGPDDLS
jgi:hypothetical protein